MDQAMRSSGLSALCKQAQNTSNELNTKGSKPHYLFISGTTPRFSRQLGNSWLWPITVYESSQRA
jgi:hypothetical protein